MKMKLSTLFVLLVCALAAATSLTPIIAKALTPSTEETCEQRLARIGEIVAEYRRETGHLPLRIRDVVPAELLTCPVYGRTYWYKTPDINVRERSPRQVQDYLRVLGTIDWDTVPYLLCACHFDEEQVDYVVWAGGYPVPVSKEGVRHQRYLSGFVGGDVRYTDAQDWEPLDAVYQWMEENPEDGGGQ
jgi:hypothetical protein